MKKIIAVALYLFFGLSAHGRADWERLSETTIRLSGLIEKGSLEKYRQVSKSGYTKLIVQSAGGFPLIALKIAQDIRQREVEVVVDSYCFSACANYLALAGKRLTVPCEALLGWHGSPTLESREELRKRAIANSYPEELIEKYWQWLSTFATDEQKFYDQIGVDNHLLRDSVSVPSSIETKPKTTFTFDEETGTPTVSVTSTAPLWIPTPDVLAQYGVVTTGFCKNYSHSDIQSALKKKGFNLSFWSSGRNDRLK
jgi:hypothetical protein